MDNIIFNKEVESNDVKDDILAPKLNIVHSVPLVETMQLHSSLVFCNPCACNLSVRGVRLA